MVLALLMGKCIIQSCQADQNESLTEFEDEQKVPIDEEKDK